MQRGWYLKDRIFFTPDLQKQKQRFLENSTAKSFEKGDIVFFEGDEGNSCCYVASGLVRIFSVADSGKEPVFFLRRAGEMFGLSETFGHVPRTTNAQALVKTQLHIMPGAVLERMLEEDYSLARRVIVVLGNRVRQLRNTIRSFATESVMTRLVNLLFSLVYEQLPDDRDWDFPVTVPFRLSQEQLAAITGSTQPTVSYMLQKLQKEGLIRIEHRQITVLDPIRLISTAEISCEG